MLHDTLHWRYTYCIDMRWGNVIESCFCILLRSWFLHMNNLQYMINTCTDCEHIRLGHMLAREACMVSDQVKPVDSSCQSCTENTLKILYCVVCAVHEQYIWLLFAGIGSSVQELIGDTFNKIWDNSPPIWLGTTPSLVTTLCNLLSSAHTNLGIPML